MSVGQTEFTAALLDPNLATPNGLIDPAGRPAGKRFDVYRNNVISSLLDAMRTAFPVIEKLVGTEFFNAMAGVYVRDHPPQSPLLMFYGKDFPTFLQGFEPVAHLPYLADVARLELARRTSYHAADATPIDGQTLIDIPPEQLMETRFDLAPSLIILSSPYPIQSIWHFNTVDTSTPVQQRAENVVLTRPALDVTADLVPDAVSVFLTELQKGQTLGAAFETATQKNETFDLSSALGTMLGGGMITNIK